VIGLDTDYLGQHCKAVTQSLSNTLTTASGRVGHNDTGRRRHFESKQTCGLSAGFLFSRFQYVGRVIGLQ